MSKRKLEKSIHTDLSRDDDYTGYLQLDKLLERLDKQNMPTVG